MSTNGKGRKNEPFCAKLKDRDLSFFCGVKHLVFGYEPTIDCVF